MSQEPQIPSEAERKVFVEKLGQFRSTLQPKEQAMLDGMAMAAFHDQGADVELTEHNFWPDGARDFCGGGRRTSQKVLVAS